MPWSRWTSLSKDSVNSSGLAVLGCMAGRAVKQVIVVDDDVDPFDPLAVEWAVATRVQPHRDVDIIKEVQGVVLDPSMPNTKSG